MSERERVLLVTNCNSKLPLLALCFSSSALNLSNKNINILKSLSSCLLAKYLKKETEMKAVFESKTSTKSDGNIFWIIIYPQAKNIKRKNLNKQTDGSWNSSVIVVEI